MNRQTRFVIGLSTAISYLAVAYFMYTGHASIVLTYMRELGYDPTFVIVIFIVSALANLYIGARGLCFNIMWHTPLVLIALMTAFAAWHDRLTWYPVALYLLAFVRLGIDSYQDYKYGTDRQYA